jgi:hypothetical protein
MGSKSNRHILRASIFSFAAEVLIVKIKVLYWLLDINW